MSTSSRIERAERRASTRSCTFDEDGLYPIVTHKFSNVGKGALGLFQVGDVESTGAGH